MLDAITGWSLFAGLTLSIGAAATRWFVLPPPTDPSGPRRDRLMGDAARAGFAASVLVAVGVALYFVRQLSEFRDPFVPWTEDAVLLLTGTDWGLNWRLAAGAALLLVGAFGAAARGLTAAWWIATPAAGALGFFPAATGHAAAAERLGTLVFLSDVVHVWAAGAWIGGLATILYLERQAVHARGGESLLPSLVPRFSPLAMASVGILIVTGVFASWSHLPSTTTLFEPGYGRTLLIKLGIVAVVLALGARNFRTLTPRLGSADGDRAMRRSAGWELAIAQVVLVVTALLVRMSPLGH